MAADFPNVGISWFADMAEFDFPVLEIRYDNQLSTHRGDYGSKLIDMNVTIPFLEF